LIGSPSLSSGRQVPVTNARDHSASEDVIVRGERSLQSEPVVCVVAALTPRKPPAAKSLLHESEFVISRFLTRPSSQ
jgi:hypothetical protein